jgi:GR25 family glycosyltransferase involved in LPS biosynthesis
MNSYIIYVKGHSKSEEYMGICRESCKGTGFNAIPFPGVTKKTLDSFERDIGLEPLEGSRASAFWQNDKNLYHTKKSCFYNHIRLWRMCVESDEPIAVIEQDSFCSRHWDNLEFDELLIMNVKSAFKQKVFNPIRKQMDAYKFENGLSEYRGSPLQYTKKNKFSGGSMMPGTAAYAVTPKGAKRLLDNLAWGWEQSDYFINTNTVHIQYMNPEYFTFKLPNLNLSHGVK